VLKNSAGPLLTIQKFIYLLDEFHYKEFAAHLNSVNATLPLKLAETIRRKLPAFDSHPELCRKIYGGADKQHVQNFNQLASYTFKLSGGLAQNYPGYLHSNILRLQQMVNDGGREEVDLLTESLLGIAEKTGDFQCQVWTLQFLSQQAFIMEDTVRGLELNGELVKVIGLQSLLVALQTELRNAKYAANLVEDEAEFKRCKNYFLQYFAHVHPSIRIYSRFACLCATYERAIVAFEDQEVKEIIYGLDKEFQNYPFLVFPFLADLKGDFDFMKLNSPFTFLNTREGEKEFSKLTEHYDSIKYWNSYLNLAQLNLITIQGTRLLTNYHYQVHRNDYQKTLPEKDRRWFKYLLDKCSELLNSKVFRDRYEAHIRRLKMLHGAFLILSGGTGIKDGIRELELLLTTYQQVNLKGSTGSIYLCLMVGYFSLADYGKCVHTHRRYAKASKGKGIFEGNDTRINAYYYLSQWLLTGSKQYASKTDALIARHYDKIPVWLGDLAERFNMPLKPIQTGSAEHKNPPPGARTGKPGLQRMRR
jgi:hypothetical protein